MLIDLVKSLFESWTKKARCWEEVESKSENRMWIRVLETEKLKSVVKSEVMGSFSLIETENWKVSR